jgi:cytochrome P450
MSKATETRMTAEPIAAPAADARQTARAEAYAQPLETLNPAQQRLFQSDTMWPWFERLRREDPVHYTPESAFGPYWSITTYNDIMAVDTNHGVFSSEGGIMIGGGGRPGDAPGPGGGGFFGQPGLGLGGPSMFIAMDPPKHDVQRKTVSPALSPTNVQAMEPVIRERVAAILDDLPIGEEFDWVDKVSMELTAMTLATLFDIPQQDRRRLTRWSDVVIASPGHGVVETKEQKRAEMFEFAAYFTDIWNQRVNAAPTGDLISMLAHGADTRGMDQREFLGNVVLLTIGGNDTTRNSITGSVYALNKYPAEYAKLRADPSLIPSMVSETIRWQTPLAHMRRTAKEDIEFRGKQIRAGDKVVMWYVSGNRDEGVIANADDYIIDRERPRTHLSFGFGIHRCVGNRLAELQLRVVWEEILKRFPRIEITAEPDRVYSTFVKGYERQPVVIPARL